MPTRMEFLAFLYIVVSDFTNAHGCVKLGLTIHPVHRLRVYHTGDAPGCGLLKRYAAIYQVRAFSRADLREFERQLMGAFAAKRLRHEGGGSSEWFRVTEGEVADYITRQPFFIRQLSIEEVREIHTLAQKLPSSAAASAEKEELIWMGEQNALPSPLEYFTDCVLPGGALRRNQVELWHRLTAILDDATVDLRYRGIVQWPTGCGKTIAMLMIICKTAELCARLGLPYRGILVSPKNDILRTLGPTFQLLESFGIQILDGSHGQFSKLEIPNDDTTSFLVVVCQAALTAVDTIDYLPMIHHVHYDEVHRITGELFFNRLKERLSAWNTLMVTGTSATPKTCSKDQQRKLAELFGDELSILHRCDVDEAVREGWIAPPRFIPVVLPKLDDRAAMLEAFVEANMRIYEKKGRPGKVILYIETSVEEARYAAEFARRQYPSVKVYSAIDGGRTDDAFIAAPAKEGIHVLFACQRFREGSDIRGVEMTGTLIGGSVSAHILLQICGRGMRLDYPEKEGWCVIAQACEDDRTGDEILDSILLDILEFLGAAGKTGAKRDIEAIVRTYMGDISADGLVYSVEETVDRVQAAYLRREYMRRTPKEVYALIREMNVEMGLRSRIEYEEQAASHPRYIPEPKAYFSDFWQSWYHFLGVDISAFPASKGEWKLACMERGIRCWEDYKQKRGADLPEDPNLLYEDFTNVNAELGWAEEDVW